MRRVLVFLAAMTLVLATAAPAAANNDPHRVPFGFGSFDLVGPCPFTVHFDTWGNEYATSSSLPDGWSVVKVTGFGAGTLSNPGNGKTVYLNLSGPGTFMFAPDGTFTGQTSTGRGIIWAPNLTAFGLPSNLVATSGPSTYTAVGAANWAGYVITAMTAPPHVVLDVCAALA